MNVPTHERPRLLIVEDSPHDQALYRRSLGDAFTLEFSSTGEDGLGRLAAEPFDLVVLDHHLPGLNGGEVLDAIRQTMRREIPVVVATGSGSEEMATDLLRRGASDYILKTDLSGPRLASSIAAALDRYRLARDRERALAELRRQRDELAATLRKLREAPGRPSSRARRWPASASSSPASRTRVNNPLAYVSNSAAVLARDVRIVADLGGLYRPTLGDAAPARAGRGAEARGSTCRTRCASFDRLIESSPEGPGAGP